MFKAWLIQKDEMLKYKAEFIELKESQLPPGNVLVRITHSGMNYKDALALTGKAPVVRKFPLVPGIDFGGVVESSDSPLYKLGDKVILTGWEVGELHWGGLSQLARVKAEWLVKLPEPFSIAQAMGVGTAGFTAMLAILALEKYGIRPHQGLVLVTGANGGVGGFAVNLLAKAGYTVIAATGRPEEEASLRSIGASEVIHRDELSEPSKPLSKERWAAAIDSVGSHTLANICAALQRDGAVAACGMAQGIDFPGSVAPFILRGIALLGINSVLCPTELRETAWQRLASDLDLHKLEEMIQHRPLSEAMNAAKDLIAGKVKGRIVIDIANK